MRQWTCRPFAASVEEGGRANEHRVHKYAGGERVVAAIDLLNDGSRPAFLMHALLVERGATGELAQVGKHVDTDTPIYLVEFAGGRVVGCLEDEIAPV